MLFLRTANAGGLIVSNNINILIDGVCGELSPYIKTPDDIKQEFILNPPQIVAFTHNHIDHYDEGFAGCYKKITGRKILGVDSTKSLNCDGVTVSAIKTKHIGKENPAHYSFLIKGEKTVLFTGDASPLQWKNIGDLGHLDAVIVPYAYANTKPAWEITKGFGATKVILLHMPMRQLDEYGLYDMVNTVAGDDETLVMPEIGQEITL